MAIQKIEVEAESIVKEIGGLSAKEIDELPFGAIQLDENGVVLSYNRFEAKFARRNKEDVIGRNFFSEIAPCTRVKAFHGPFLEGVRRKRLDEVFDFIFRFPHGSVEVRVRMVYATTGRESIWIFVTPIE